MNKKRIGIIAGIIFGIVTLLAAGGVLASSLLTQHNTLNIIGSSPPPPPAAPNLAIFSDAGATTALADPLAWGDLTVGGNMTKTYYVKNTGTGAATVSIVLPTVSWGTVTTSPATGFSLAATAVQQVDVTVAVSSTATPATGQTFDVGFSY